MAVLRPIGAALVASLLLALALFARPAAAETTVCTQINSLPVTIGTPGHYCLNYNFAADYATAAININASNVELDCTGHVVTQIGAAAVAGVYVLNKTQVTVRNCVLVGFGRGIAFFESTSGQSRNNAVLDNHIRRAKLFGILMNGSYNRVVGNHVSQNTGLAGNYTSYGILLSSANLAGAGNVVSDNTVTGAALAGTTVIIGINLDAVSDTQLEHNHVGSLYPPTGGYAYGVVGNDSAFNTVAVGNSVIAARGTPPGGGDAGGTSADGMIFYANSTGANHNLCRDNQVGHWGADITGETGGVGCVKLDNLEF
jgi:parallel beta-helix repeat protein